MDPVFEEKLASLHDPIDRTNAYFDEMERLMRKKFRIVEEPLEKSIESVAENNLDSKSVDFDCEKIRKLEAEILESEAAVIVEVEYESQEDDVQLLAEEPICVGKEGSTEIDEMDEGSSYSKQNLLQSNITSDEADSGVLTLQMVIELQNNGVEYSIQAEGNLRDSTFHACQVFDQIPVRNICQYVRVPNGWVGYLCWLFKYNNKLLEEQKNVVKDRIQYGGKHDEWKVGMEGRKEISPAHQLFDHMVKYEEAGYGKKNFDPGIVYLADLLGHHNLWQMAGCTLMNAFSDSGQSEMEWPSQECTIRYENLGKLLFLAGVNAVSGDRKVCGKVIMVRNNTKGSLLSIEITYRKDLCVFFKGLQWGDIDSAQYSLDIVVVMSMLELYVVTMLGVVVLVSIADGKSQALSLFGDITHAILLHIMALLGSFPWCDLNASPYLQSFHDDGQQEYNVSQTRDDTGKEVVVSANGLGYACSTSVITGFVVLRIDIVLLLSRHCFGDGVVLVLQYWYIGMVTSQGILSIGSSWMIDALESSAMSNFALGYRLGFLATCIYMGRWYVIHHNVNEPMNSVGHLVITKKAILPSMVLNHLYVHITESLYYSSWVLVMDNERHIAVQDDVKHVLLCGLSGGISDMILLTLVGNSSKVLAIDGNTVATMSRVCFDPDVAIGVGRDFRNLFIMHKPANCVVTVRFLHAHIEVGKVECQVDFLGGASRQIMKARSYSEYQFSLPSTVARSSIIQDNFLIIFEFLQANFSNNSQNLSAIRKFTSGILAMGCHLYITCARFLTVVEIPFLFSPDFILLRGFIYYTCYKHPPVSMASAVTSRASHIHLNDLLSCKHQRVEKLCIPADNASKNIGNGFLNPLWLIAWFTMTHYIVWQGIQGQLSGFAIFCDYLQCLHAYRPQGVSASLLIVLSLKTTFSKALVFSQEAKALFNSEDRFCTQHHSATLIMLSVEGGQLFVTSKLDILMHGHHQANHEYIGKLLEWMYLSVLLFSRIWQITSQTLFLSIWLLAWSNRRESMVWQCFLLCVMFEELHRDVFRESMVHTRKWVKDSEPDGNNLEFTTQKLVAGSTAIVYAMGIILSIQLQSAYGYDWLLGYQWDTTRQMIWPLAATLNFSDTPATKSTDSGNSHKVNRFRQAHEHICFQELGPVSISSMRTWIF